MPPVPLPDPQALLSALHDVFRGVQDRTSRWKRPGKGCYCVSSLARMRTDAGMWRRKGGDDDGESENGA
jgi:hypothetical protein